MSLLRVEGRERRRARSGRTATHRQDRRVLEHVHIERFRARIATEDERDNLLFPFSASNPRPISIAMDQVKHWERVVTVRERRDTETFGVVYSTPTDDFEGLDIPFFDYEFFGTDGVVSEEL